MNKAHRSAPGASVFLLLLLLELPQGVLSASGATPGSGDETFHSATADGLIQALASDLDGGFLVGGQFTNIGTERANRYSVPLVRPARFYRLIKP